MFLVAKKIENTSIALDKWQRPFFGDINAIRGRLEELLGLSSSPVLQAEKNALLERLEALLSEEETYWCQRARVSWLKDGDRNTGFFYRKASNRKRKFFISGLHDEAGDWYEDDEGLENIVVHYFENMYKAGVVDSTALEETLQAIIPSVSEDMNLSLCTPYSSEELLKQINFTHICLIPKVDSPETMADLRPIALCNVIYKLCSKVIANRLKMLLPQIISPFQSAFIPGRLITDNTLAANELAHFIHNKRSGDEFMALKLDLSKAYDRYSFQVWGKPRGYVVPTRGLRKGDPLSPYLFLLGAEGLSALLLKKAELGVLLGISICEGAPMVNHLLFADDSMLYAKANLQACQAISNVLEVYGKASGQQVNFHKSSVTFSKNVGIVNQRLFASSLGVEGWRILQYPTSLITRMYKARYFPNSTFWEAESHPTPSFSWRSIFAARSVLEKGARWQIGDGKDVLLSDPWVLNNYLPTVERLIEKQVPLESGTCILCGVENETAEHLCRYCPFVMETLAAVPGLARVGYSSAATQFHFVDWLWYCASHLSSQLWAIFVHTLWGIWRERNARVWDNKHTVVANVVMLPSVRLQEYQRHHSKNKNGGNRRVVPWKPPSAGWVKVNFDGAYHGATGTGGIGVIIRDDMGQCLGGCYAPVSNVSSAEQVEALAGREAVSLAIQRVLSPVIIETDSVTLLHATKQRVIPHTSFIGRVYDDIIFHLQ
ncbi:uncharacterized protein LOC133744226 [Rosa rugosa]|uniref:uncharacterized protein LOC133744226 n=1 Tax=Rosa rugosa TaxID=74645 RepID=UPI002B406DDD|nr:uncharacterized protein LOC133744226 [Rosa rugosa]